MILNNSDDLRQSGFDSSLLGFDDLVKDGVDKTALDIFLDRALSIANKRLGSWVTEIKNLSEFKQAELYLAMVVLLPFVWARSGVGPVSLSIEGMQITNRNPTEDEKTATIKRLVSQAEFSVVEFIKDGNFETIMVGGS